jgi:hypothetical protein
MNQWAFVIAAYAITVVGVGGLVIASCLAMRRAESTLDELSSR